MIDQFLEEIREEIKNNIPTLSEQQIVRMKKIINSSDPNFEFYGLKMSDIEKIAKSLLKKTPISYQDALEVFKSLINTSLNDEKFAALSVISQFKKNFDGDFVETYRRALEERCDSWAFCDSSCIKAIGPFLAKKGNETLAKRTIEEWSNSDNLWVRRASMVILLKIVMIKKAFDETYVFSLVEKMLKYPEDYIRKGIGWLLKTCSNYEPAIIFEYLKNNKSNLTPLILRYASEKLPKEKRALLLKARKK